MITLRIEDCPDIAQTNQQAKALQEQRYRAGREYLLAFGRRWRRETQPLQATRG